MKAVSVEEAVAMIPNGASVMVGGFMGVGTPERLLDELVRQRKSELSIISNDAAVPGKGVGKLFDAALVSTLTTSHIGLNPNVQKQMMANKVAVDLVPQGTLVERIRAGGCGLGGVLTPTGVGTIVEEGKRQIEVDGKNFLLETALRSDFALIHAFLADYLGNLAYALTARNFNPDHGNGGRYRHRHCGAHRSGRRHRARPCRNARRRSSTISSPTGEPWMLNRSSRDGSHANFAQVTSSISASGFRRWSRITFRPISRYFFSRRTD